MRPSVDGRQQAWRPERGGQRPSARPPRRRSEGSASPSNSIDPVPLACSWRHWCRGRRGPDRALTLRPPVRGPLARRAVRPYCVGSSSSPRGSRPWPRANIRQSEERWSRCRLARRARRSARDRLRVGGGHRRGLDHGDRRRRAIPLRLVGLSPPDRVGEVGARRAARRTTSSTPTTCWSSDGPARPPPRRPAHVDLPAPVLRRIVRLGRGDLCARPGPARPRCSCRPSATSPTSTRPGFPWPPTVSHRRRNALARWLMACFSSGVISAKVRPSPSTGSTIGS